MLLLLCFQIFLFLNLIACLQTPTALPGTYKYAHKVIIYWLAYIFGAHETPTELILCNSGVFKTLSEKKTAKIIKARYVHPVVSFAVIV